MNAPPRPRSLFLAVLPFMLAGAAITLWVTRAGVGFNSDSASYVEAARSLLKSGTMQAPSHHGHAEPLRHWPPLYPALLALASGGGDVLQGARWLDAGVFCLNLLLLAGLARQLRLTPSAGVYIGLIFILAPVVLWAHVMAMSEATCLLFWLTGLWLLLEYQRRQTWPLLLAAAAAAAATVMTRYLGLAHIFAGILFVFIYSAGGFGRKFGRVAAYALLALAPLLVWLGTRGSNSFGGAIDRDVGFHGLAPGQMGKCLSAFAHWLAPFDGGLPVKLAVTALLGLAAAAWLVALFKNHPKLLAEKKFSVPESAPAFLLLTNILASEAVILLVALFIDPIMDLSERMHLLSFVLSLLLLGAVGSAFQRSPANHGLPRKTFLVLSALLLAIYLVAGSLWLVQARARHLEINNSAWQNLAGESLLTERYNGGPLYSNFTDWIYLRTGRPDINNLPSVLKGTRNQPNPALAEETAAMLHDLAANHGAIVYFKNNETRMLSADDLRKNSRLRVADETPDFIFFQATPAENK